MLGAGHAGRRGGCRTRGGELVSAGRRQLSHGPFGFLAKPVPAAGGWRDTGAFRAPGCSGWVGPCPEGCCWLGRGGDSSFLLLPNNPLASEALSFIPLPAARHQLPITHKCSTLQIRGAWRAAAPESPSRQDPGVRTRPGGGYRLCSLTPPTLSCLGGQTLAARAHVPLGSARPRSGTGGCGRGAGGGPRQANQRGWQVCSPDRCRRWPTRLFCKILF